MALIKAFYSDQVGAPLLNGTVGSLIAVLDACLVNGYNQVAVSTMTRDGAIVTVNTVTPHGYGSPYVNYWDVPGVGNIATIAGANEAAYNGEWAVTWLNPSTFTFNIGSSTPPTPATGAITTKRAPAGFGKPFADTNRGVYRSNDPTSRRHFLQVNDIADCPNGQGARYAGWRGYENMSSLYAGEYPFPTIVAAGVFGHYLLKSSALDASYRHWSIHSDGKTFFLVIHPDQGGVGISGYCYMAGFGDFTPTVPDAYATIISGLTTSSSSYSANSNAGFGFPSGASAPNPGVGSGWTCIPRKANGQATPVFAAGLLACGLAQSYSFGVSSYLSFPNYVDNRFYMSQMQVYEAANLRGSLPLYEGMHGIVHGNREIISNVIGREGRSFAYIRTGAANPNAVGGLYIDMTGPWS